MTKFESNCSQLPLKDLEEHNAKMKEVAAYPASAEEIRTNGTTSREKTTRPFFCEPSSFVFTIHQFWEEVIFTPQYTAAHRGRTGRVDMGK